MEANTIREEHIRGYRRQLECQEKSPATVAKYTRGARAFADWLGESTLTKEAVIAYKEQLAGRHTAAGGNGALAAVNGLLNFLGRPNLKVKPFKVQRGAFLSPERELGRAEFDRLLQAAERRGKSRLALVMQTIFATGIRVSELRFITVETATCGRAEIRLKGKTRTIILPTKLRQKLKHYAREKGVESGPIFVTRGGKPLDRSNIWHEMKRLCALAKVSAKKVFPHNLRHLFARTYFKKSPNLAELADLLGHSDVNTTRIYTATSGAEYQKRLDALGLVV
jgi:integrase